MVDRPGGALARDFPTGLTILKVLALVRWLAWGWMFAVVAFSGDALRHPVVAWLAVAAGLALATASTWWLRTAPERLLAAPFVATEAVLALAFTVLDGWVYEPGHVFVTSQNLATQWPLIAAVSIGVAAGPVAGGAYGALVGPARWVAAELNDFGEHDPKPSSHSPRQACSTPQAGPCSAGSPSCCAGPSGRSPTAERATKWRGCSTTPCCRRWRWSSGGPRPQIRSWRRWPGRRTSSCGRSSSTAGARGGSPRRSPRSCSASAGAWPAPSRRARSPSANGRCQLVARGHTYAEIGAELSIAPKTAENDVRNILGKLHLTRRSDLVPYAVQHGLD
jgi:hypothetical protein